MLFGIIPLVTSVGVTLNGIPLLITEDMEEITGIGFNVTTIVKALLVIHEGIFAFTW